MLKYWAVLVLFDIYSNNKDENDVVHEKERKSIKNIRKMRLNKRRNKLLTYLVIFMNLYVLCHNFNLVEGSSPTQFSTSQNDGELSGLFSEEISLSPQFRSIIDADEDEEYYYDGDDDPYGLGNEDGDESYSAVDDTYENYDESTGSEFSSKSGKYLLISENADL